MVNCESCGGKKDCSDLGCDGSSHYHCDCGEISVGGKSNKRAFEDRKIDQALKRRGY